MASFSGGFVSHPLIPSLIMPAAMMREGKSNLQQQQFRARIERRTMRGLRLLFLGTLWVTNRVGKRDSLPHDKSKGDYSDRRYDLQRTQRERNET